MNSQWLKGAKDKEARKERIKGHALAFEDLTEVLEGLLKETAPDYDSPSWAYKQADQNGYNQAIRSVINLIKL